MAAGARRAAREASAAGQAYDVVLDGPTHPVDVKTQVHLVDAAARPQVAGILLAALDRFELAGPVDRATGRGLPVVSVEAGVDSTHVAGSVGDANFQAGRVAGQCLGQALKGRGNVIVLRHHIGAADTEQREQGFIEAMRDGFPEIHLVVTDFHAGPSAAIAGRVVPSLIGRFEGRLDGIYASSEVAGSAVLAELRRRGSARPIAFVAIEDEGNVLRAALGSGLIQGLVTLDPEAIGYAAAGRLIGQLRSAAPGPAPAPSLALLTPEHPAGAALPAGLSLDPRTVVAAGSGLLVVPGAQLAMVAIPPGEFDMGSGPAERQFRDSDSPRRHVRISRGFWLGKFEVTQRQWRAVMADNPSDFSGEQHPVDNVTWEQASAFCQRLTALERAAQRLPDGYAYQLPTEAQWEYACRAGSAAARDGPLDDLGWYVGNSGSWSEVAGPTSRQNALTWQMTTHPVGQKAPNRWGLYDMYGNVLEWCRDVYGPYQGTDLTDPVGPAAGEYRVLRGGGWWTDPEVCFAFSRSKAPVGRHHSALGLRVALSPIP